MKSQKNILDELYVVLATECSAIKSDAYTSVIREPGEAEVTIRDSDAAKFEIKGGTSN